MKPRASFLVLALAALLGVGAWLGWRWVTTPAPPELPLDRAEKAVAEAVGKALDTVRERPRSGEAWGQLAMVMSANGYDEQAADSLAHAEWFDPDNPRWPYLRGHQLLRGNPRQALPYLRRALERSATKEQRSAVLFRLALVLIEEGELDEAERHLRALRELEPNGPRTHFGLGLLAVARDDRPTARAHLAPLADHVFTRKRASAHLAALALADGDEETARLYQRRAAQFPPDLPWPDPFLAEQGRHEVSQLSRLIQVEALEGRGRLREAAGRLREVVAATPDAHSWLALGIVQAKLGDYEEAEAALRTALDLDPGKVQAHYFLGTILFFRGEERHNRPGGKEEALALFRAAVAAEDRALALKDDHAFAHLTRGRALLHLGRTDEALAALRMATAIRPEYANPHLSLGEALAEAGRVAESLPHLENAARFAQPGDTRGRDALAKWRAKAAKSNEP